MIRDKTIQLNDIFLDTGLNLRNFVLQLPYVTSLRDIPHKSGVYFLVDDGDEILRVGQSKDIYRRWAQRKRSNFSLQFPRRLYLLCEHNTHFSLEALESIFILLL